MMNNEPPRDDQDTPIVVKYYNHISGEWDDVDIPLRDMTYDRAIVYVPKGGLERFHRLTVMGEKPGIAMLIVLSERGSGRL